MLLTKWHKSDRYDPWKSLSFPILFFMLFKFFNFTLYLLFRYLLSIHYVGKKVTEKRVKLRSLEVGVVFGKGENQDLLVMRK